jgi:hypothetical protein
METKMTPVQIAAEIARIEKLLGNKGYYNPVFTIRMNWVGYQLSGELEVRTDAHLGAKNHYIHLSYTDGFGELFTQAEAYIANLPTIEDAKRDAFIAAVGRLIDQGKDIGIEVDFLNPLTDMMTKLSSNIITHQ